MATIIQQIIFGHIHVFLITLFWHKQFRGAPHALVYLCIVTPALWYFMLVCNVRSNSASRQWGPDGRHAECGLAAADRGHHHPPRFFRCYGAAGTETGVPQVLEGQLWLCLWSKHAVAGPFSVMEQQELGQEFLQWLNLVCGQCMRLQKNPLLWWRSGTRVPQVFVGLLMLC